MKTHEIKTEKGEFVVKEYSQDRGKTIAQALLDKFCGRMDGYEFICKLSEATEEDAKGMVDEFEFGTKPNPHLRFFHYIEDRCNLASPLDSLHSLLNSKGIDINNGNWYLFKKV